MVARFRQERWRICVVALLFLAFAPWHEAWVRRLYLLTAEPAIWQLVTAHFTHWSWPHLLNNFIAALCLIGLYGRYWSNRELLYCVAGVWAALTIYLTLLYTRSFYLGASGLLYSLFFYAALRFWRQQPAINSLVVGYIIWSILMPQTRVSIGVPIASEVHIVGILAATVMLTIRPVWGYLSRLH